MANYPINEEYIRAELARSTGEISLNGKSITNVVIPAIESQIRGFRGQGNLGADATAADYTAILDDAGKLITMNRGTSQTATVPPNSSVAFTAFTDVLTWLQVGAGAFTVTAGAGVTLIPPPGKTAVSNGVGAIVSAVKLSTNTWQVYGDLVPS